MFVETEKKGRRERKEARIRSISKRVRLGQRIELFSTPEKDSFPKGKERDGEEESETDMEERKLETASSKV